MRYNFSYPIETIDKLSLGRTARSVIPLMINYWNLPNKNRKFIEYNHISSNSQTRFRTNTFLSSIFWVGIFVDSTTIHILGDPSWWVDTHIKINKHQRNKKERFLCKNLTKYWNPYVSTLAAPIWLLYEYCNLKRFIL